MNNSNTIVTNIAIESLEGSLTLILGGVRSGKSRFGEQLARSLGSTEVAYVATAENRDEEMRRRVEKHREQRSKGWTTYEVPMGLGEFLTSGRIVQSVVLIDCLTLLVSNILCEWDYQRTLPTADFSHSLDAVEERILREVDAIQSVAVRQNKHVIVVSGEVGLGIVPESELGRIFRDLLGFANQRLSSSANETVWMMAGNAIPLSAKSISADALATALKQMPFTISAEH